MATKNEATLTFTGDTKQLHQSFDKVGADAKHMSDKVEGSSRRAAGSFKKFGAVAAVGVAAAGVALFAFAKDSIGAFVEAEQAQTRLSDAFARFPKLADTNIDKLRALNTVMASKTKFDDDAFASGQAVLAQFKLSGKQIEGLTPLLADYAAKTGKDLPTAAGTLGKAFLGNTKALKALGINYKSTGNQALDVKNITQLLRDKVGGFAEKEGKTAAGQAAILSNRFGEVKETVGQKLLPVMLKLTTVGLKIVDWIMKNSKVIGPLVALIAAVTVVQWAWNFAMAANPIGLIIIGIALLVAAIVIIATRTKWFQRVWGAAWGGIKHAAVNVWNWLHGLPHRLGGVFRGLANVLTAPFRAAFNFIADAWNNTVGSLSFHIPGWVPGIGGKGWDVPDMPHFHSGGIVPGPPGANVVAMLQAGERVIPAGGGGGNQYSITVHAGLGEPREVGRAVVHAIQSYERANGAGWRTA